MLKTKPIIGVMPLFDDDRGEIWMRPSYLDGITDNGGIPITLPLRASKEDVIQVCKMCDGFLFTGGQDMDPKFYNENPSEYLGVINHERDRLEAIAFEYAISTEKPIFGICRGMQVINIMLGGTLYQDLPSEYDSKLPHTIAPPNGPARHDMTAVLDTPLYDLLKVTNFEVNSYHHQAVKKLAPKLETMAISEDGLIEAIYMPERKFLWAVQWHPEHLYKADVNANLLFKAFVESCEK